MFYLRVLRRQCQEDERKVTHAKGRMARDLRVPNTMPSVYLTQWCTNANPKVSKLQKRGGIRVGAQTCSRNSDGMTCLDITHRLKVDMAAW